MTIQLPKYDRNLVKGTLSDLGASSSLCQALQHAPVQLSRRQKHLSLIMFLIIFIIGTER